jgi:hypothetical protein
LGRKKQNNSSNNSTPEVEIIPTQTPIKTEDLQFQKLLQFANLAKLIKKDLNSNQQVSYTFHKNFNKDKVMEWMANPQKYEKQLRDLSRFLYDTSSHYKRLIQYFSTMLTYDYVVEPYGMTEFKPDKKVIESIQQKYLNIINFLETMNLKHEFAKISEKAWIEDCVYAYEYRLKDSYFLQTLNPDYCQISSIEDGVYNFSFDFSFFDKYPKEINKYADEFKKKYDIYKTDKKNSKWQELDSEKTICIKINESIDYIIPPFAGIFEEIYEIEDYKSLKKAKTELDNYLLLVTKIPYMKDTTNENAFALSIDKAIEYFNMAMESLPEQVGGMLSPFESVEAVKVDRGDKNTDSVLESENALYNSAGVSKLLFNSDNASGAALTKSMRIDQWIAFKSLRQFERWTNRKLKSENKIIKFKATFLDITRENQIEYVGMLKEAATLGLPCKMQYCAAIGMSPSSMMSMTFFENDVMNITEKFIPLSSSYTQSGKDGRPNKEEGSLTESGQKTKEQEQNNPDNRKG